MEVGWGWGGGVDEVCSGQFEESAVALPRGLREQPRRCSYSGVDESSSNGNDSDAVTYSEITSINTTCEHTHTHTRTHARTHAQPPPPPSHTHHIRHPPTPSTTPPPPHTHTRDGLCGRGATLNLNGVTKEHSSGLRATDQGDTGGHARSRQWS